MEQKLETSSKQLRTNGQLENGTLKWKQMTNGEIEKWKIDQIGQLGKTEN